MYTLVSARLCDFTVRTFVKQERKISLRVEILKISFSIILSLLSCPYVIVRIFKRKRAKSRFNCNFCTLIFKGRGFGAMRFYEKRFFYLSDNGKLAFPEEYLLHKDIPEIPSSIRLFFQHETFKGLKMSAVFFSRVL